MKKFLILITTEMTGKTGMLLPSVESGEREEQKATHPEVSPHPTPSQANCP